MKDITSFKRCLTKVAYASEAKATAKAERDREKYNDPTIAAYLCNLGGHYHLGHAIQPAKDGRGEK